MQAENTHSRQKRQRLWYQRDGFLWGLVVALIAAAWGLLPPAGTSLGIGGLAWACICCSRPSP